jgi:DNA-directed RNA polymerase beta subunit
MPSLLSALPGAQAIAAPKYREFGDSENTRRLIFDNVLKKATAFEPLTTPQHTLRLANVGYEGPEKYSVKDQKTALLENKSLSRRLRGDWELVDNASGQVIDNKRMTLAQVPYLTRRGTFVVNGNEYTLSNQLRLRSGVYTRVKDNGELESHVNLLPGKGRTHRFFLDPKSGVFRIQMGQAKMPLYPLLKAMGMTDKDVRAAWGNDLTAVNMAKDDPQVIDKLYKRLIQRGDPSADRDSKRQAVREVLEKMELDPEVTKRTLGKGFTNVNAEQILATTKKLLQVSRQEADPDDRDHLAYQNLVGPEELFAERFGRDKMGLRRMLWRASAQKSLKPVQPNHFTKGLMTALMGSGLGMPIEEINPADIFDQQSRVTRLGEGGIPSLDAVPEEARNVQPSQFGFIDFLRTPESGKVGVDARLSRAVRKGEDGRLYVQFQSAKTGKPVWKSPQDLTESIIAFPGELKTNKPWVAALENGKIKYVDRKRVDYTLKSMEESFSPLSNMVPFKSAVKGQRAVMASRMFTQALPLRDGEAPLVQSGMPGEKDKSFEQAYAKHMGALRADKPGVVTHVDGDSIQLKHQDGTTSEVQTYNNFPYNRKTYLHNTALVQPGDQVDAGQLLAKSNFTDASGTTALGKNARVAYLPFKGKNFEDAIVISQSFAKRMSSEHMYQHGLEWEPKMKRGKDAFISIYPSEYDKKTMAKMDKDGVIKAGTKVEYGDPLVLSVMEKEQTRNKLLRGRRPSFSNKSLVWKHHSPGEVTDVSMTKDGVNVVVKAYSPMQIGDKLSGRYGDKGVISEIVPDDQMPHDGEERPFEVLLNENGIISRTNPAQMIEAALGAIAAKTGKPYRVPDFENIDDLAKFAMGEMRKHGIKDIQDIRDPQTGRKIKEIFAGSRWFMKLHHTSEGKGQGRGLGNYTAERTPAKGGESGSKRVSLLDTSALLSHGATEVLRDAGLIRGQENPEYWSRYMSGYKPSSPKVPFVYQKFVNHLKGAGINVIRDTSGRTNLMAMTNKDIDQMAGSREITNVETVDWKGELKPIKGGLFDEKLTGGHNGDRWSYIKLHEPMPNPVMEEPIRRLLGLTKKKFEDVLAGRESINGRTGPQGVQAALAHINVDKEIEQARADIKSGRKTRRDTAVRKLGYLKSAQKMGLHPKEWVLDKAPVLPPAFRPISVLAGSGGKRMPMVADANLLYRELFEANSALKDIDGQVDDLGDERLNVYNAFKSVTGLGDPLHPKNKERKVKGILKHVFGTSPKYGSVQYRLLGSTTDLVGRAVITPNPDLDMDQVSIPEERAWEIYKPFIVRRLVRRGMSRMRAAGAAKEKSQVAREAMVEEMGARPVIINRAPVLHRYGMMAAWPRLTKSSTMEISPLVVGGFGADFDGDAMQFHVPASPEAVQEAIDKLMPSKNLFAARDFDVHYKPSQEYVGGLYNATALIDKKNKPQVFNSAEDAIRAYRQGKIDVDRKIEILKS